MVHDNKEIKVLLEKICFSSKNVSSRISLATTSEKNKALKYIAESILNRQLEIIIENKKDMKIATESGLSNSILDRLYLDQDRINSMIASIQNIIKLPDPVGKNIESWVRPNGLQISTKRIPIGVIGIIYESRPNVTSDAAALCIKSGNCSILKAGKESFYSSSKIVECIHMGLEKSGLPLEIVQAIPSKSREAVNYLLKMNQYIDILIPRGGKGLIKAVHKNSTIPVISHLDGICHTYIDKFAKKQIAIPIAINSKMRRTGICGATETILFHSTADMNILNEIIVQLLKLGCEVRGDEIVKKLNSQITLANDLDWDTEYLDSIISIKIVSNIDEAIKHINIHSSGHTDAIITENKNTAEKFINEIDSAIVMHNTSTQFSDGGEFGMGAEIGIATGRMHPRGPVGLKELTTYKYIVEGTGQIRN